MTIPWSAQDDYQLIYHRGVGSTFKSIGKLIGKTKDACQKRYRGLLVNPPEGTIVRDANDNIMTVGSTVAPFAVPIPRRANVSSLGKWQHAALYSDTHFPSQDDSALAVVASIVSDVQPTFLGHLGDLLDCYRISRFSQDPNRAESLQDEINMARAHLHQMAQVAPQARRVLLEGNHENRLQRIIWDLHGPQRELARLDNFKDAMSWPSLLGLEEIGWDFIPASQQSRTILLPNLILKHGTVVRRWSASTALGEYQKYGKSGVSGHVHRLGKFYHRDHNGSHVWMEAGCTCSTDPEYLDHPDWQQGMLVVAHTPDGSRYHVEDIYIEKGRAVYRDRDYRAA